MTTSDPIADMLARVRNALMVKQASVSMPSSKVKVAIAKILKDEGYIADYHLTNDERQHPVLVLDLKYVGDTKHQRAVITELKRVKPDAASTRPFRTYRGYAVAWVLLCCRRLRA